MSTELASQVASPGPPPVTATVTARLATLLSARWVRFYAGLVDAEVAARRRDEVASDLWEQATTTRDDPPARWVGLSILRRTVTGMAADLSWVQLQRAAAAGRSSRTSPAPGDLARGLTRFALRWWWALGALPIAFTYLLIARLLWTEPGRPYAVQLLVVLPAAGLLLVGVALRSRRPRAAAALVVIGSVPGFIAWWTPGLLAAVTLVVLGCVTELAHLTTSGTLGRVVAASAAVVLVAAMVAPFAVGFGPWWVALAVAALLTLASTARRDTLVSV